MVGQRVYQRTERVDSRPLMMGLLVSCSLIGLWGMGHYYLGERASFRMWLMAGFLVTALALAVALTSAFLLLGKGGVGYLLAGILMICGGFPYLACLVIHVIHAQLLWRSYRREEGRGLREVA